MGMGCRDFVSILDAFVFLILKSIGCPCIDNDGCHRFPQSLTSVNFIPALLVRYTIKQNELLIFLKRYARLNVLPNFI